MVIESILNPLKAKKRPWEMFFIGILYSSAAIMLSMYIFWEYSSLVSVFFTVLACAPIMYLAIKMEEAKDVSIKDEKVLLKEHGKVLTFFVFLFLGFVISFSLWYIFLPTTISAQIFEVQTKTIAQINNPMTGNAINFTATLSTIFFNNIKVLLFCLIFAFFYGVGAIFILTWNASVIGAAIGEAVRSHAGSVAYIMPMVLIKYMVHGIPEILAYFMAGLAGGIISVAVIRHDFGSDKFKRIIIDSADLTFGAVMLLVIAAILEVFVSPLVI